MPTSDGVTDADWDVIMTLAENVVHQTGLDLDPSLAKKRISLALNKLENKYGRLPSILSTKADYVDDFGERLSLLKEGYVTADEILDIKNKVFISSSIAELYIEVKNKQLAKYWIAKMKADLEGFPGDEYFQNLYLELQEMVN
jgi:hypothetical protein